MYYLDTERLHIEIADPVDLRTQTRRFDHTAFITEVVLDKQIHFCATEPRNMQSPSSGGRGLCSEFQCDTALEVVPEFAFPKFGVGILTKPDGKPYDMFRAYSYTPFNRLVEQEEGRITFTTLPLPCIGYAARETRTVWVQKNVLTMEMSFVNTGMKPIRFQEYCHNFLSLDGMAVDSDYSLELPAAAHLNERIRCSGSRGRIFKAEGEVVRILEYCPSSAGFSLEKEDFEEIEIFLWKISHKSARVSVTGTEYYRPSGMVVWVNNHIICPEVKFAQTLEPGEGISWKRQWEFDQTAKHV